MHQQEQQYDFITLLMRHQLMKTIEYWNTISHTNRNYFTEIMDMNIKLWETMANQMMMNTWDRKI